jgi:hypothetical protein
MPVLIIGRTFAGLRFKREPRARKLASLKPCERFKDLLSKLWHEPDAVVSEADRAQRIITGSVIASRGVSVLLY